MARLEQIIIRARYTLNDSAGTRYPTATLISLANEAQDAIARELNLLNAKEVFSITAGVTNYTFSSNVTEIKRFININGDKIVVKSHYDMDEIDPDWETVEGQSVEYIVIDLESPGEFRVYPKPSVNIGAIAGYARILPVPMTAISDDPDLDDIHDLAIKHYIISQLLHEDHDPNNGSLAADDFILYEDEVKESKRVSSRNNTRRNRTVQYRSGV